MADILLDKDGDIAINRRGDIDVTASIRQAVLIRLRWIYGEWRLGPKFGFPWFEEVFVKNPKIDKIKMLIRSEIVKVEGVKNATVTDVIYSRKDRTATFRYKLSIGDKIYEEEAILYG